MIEPPPNLRISGIFYVEKYLAQQDRKAAVPVFGGGLLQRTDRAAETRVVIHDVEAVKLLDRTIDCTLDVLFARNVGELKHRVAAGLLALARGRVTALTIEIGDDNCGTLAGKPDCGAAADPASWAGYDCNLFSSLAMICLPLSFATCPHEGGGFILNNRVTASLLSAARSLQVFIIR
jgi:hypothetical protein